MRWIFYSLIVANIAVFAWAMVVGVESSTGSAPVSSKNPYKDYPELPLLKEVAGDSVFDVDTAASEYDDGEQIEADDESEGFIDASGSDGDEGLDDVASPDGTSEEVALVEEGEEQGSGLVEPTPSITPAPTPTPAVAMHGDKALCQMVGAFESVDVANDFVERLRAIEVGSQVRDLELPAGPGYWVYIEPVETRREALRTLAELQAKRIDSYVIPKGDLANGISLGMFSKKALSDARVKEMTSIGLEVKVEEIERSYREIWVMLHPGDESKMSSLTWERLMEGIKGLERRQNYCLDVASE